jgi:heptosyltransferase-1
MPRILFVKTSSLGDVVHQCPAVSDAAKSLPGARIDWVVEEGFAGIARMHAAVARVIPVALRRWRRSPWKPQVWREMGAFRASLRREPYDSVVDTQGLVKSALLACLARGPRHGMDRASAREPFAARLYGRTYAVPRGRHAVERNRLLTAAALGYSFEPEVDYGLRAPAAKREKDYAVLLTMTSRADKLWPEPRWIELGRALGLPVLLPWGSPGERVRAERIAQGIGEARVLERMSVEALAGTLAYATKVAGLDSGLTHLAAALGAPTVAIFCGSDPALTGLYGAARAANVGRAGAVPEVEDVLRSFQ